MHRPHAKDLIGRLTRHGLGKRAPRDLQRVITELRTGTGGKPDAKPPRRGRR